MSFQELPAEAWQTFFDELNAALKTREVEIDVIGLDLGSLVEAEWLPLDGLTYEPKERTLFIYTGPPAGLAHAISHPEQIFVDIGTSGIGQVVVMDGEGRKHFVRLRAPLELGASGEASP